MVQSIVGMLSGVVTAAAASMAREYTSGFSLNASTTAAATATTRIQPVEAGNATSLTQVDPRVMIRSQFKWTSMLTYISAPSLGCATNRMVLFRCPNLTSDLHFSKTVRAYFI